MKKAIFSLFIALTSLCVFAQDSSPAGKNVSKEYLAVEVAVNNLSGRVNGDQFIVQGYIYPAGTLTGGNGVLADGSPEFPEAVLGIWLCDGWFLTARDETLTPAGARTVQTFEFDLINLGNNMIVSYGFEQLALAALSTRPVIGATGLYNGRAGVQNQSILALNPTGGPNYSNVFIETYDIRFKNEK